MAPYPYGRDPHEVLGVPPGATAEQIHSAYRRALRRRHPDTRDPADTEPAGSIGELQAARRELLDRRDAPPADEPETRPSAAPPRRVRFRTVSPFRYGEWLGLDRDAPEPDIPQRDLSARPGAIQPDIIAGPVRYHGPGPTR